MKSCIKCEVSKPLDAFYRHSAMADGHLNKCKECARADVKANRDANREYYLHYDRNRPNKAERCKATNAYQKTDAGKAVKKKSLQTYRDKYPGKYKAKNMVGNAIRDGKIVRPSMCQECKVECTPHAHHCDYSKPLDVMWLCEPCHQEWHRNNKAIYEAA